jgi:hypothetical protein
MQGSFTFTKNVSLIVILGKSYRETVKVAV